MTTSAEHPYPPSTLLNRVLSLRDSADPALAYELLGAQTHDALVALLPDGWSPAGRRVLDFGCGAGRTLRHFLPEADGADIWGADIDAASIDWLRRELCPPLHALHSGEHPPLALDGGSVDLAYAISVFTHLTGNSLSWLVELHRLLKPGGLLIATYMGRFNSQIFTGEPWDEDRIGMNVMHHDQPWDDGGPVVLMSDWWVREHWGRAFEVVRIEREVHGQTWALLRRRDVEITAADLQRPSDDPREHAALLNNVEQLRRERAAALAALAGSYERSLSWRATRPLRATARALRTARERAAVIRR